MVNYRYLGNSGLKVSEITYGNWVTHGSQVENDSARSTPCRRRWSGHHDVRHRGRLREHRRRDGARQGAQGPAPRVARDLHEGLLPDRPEGRRTTPGSAASTSWTRCNGSLKRLGTDYIDLYQAHRYDYETPLEETFQAFADVVRQGKALYIGVSEWTAEQLREGHALAKELGIQLISNQPQYSMLWRVIEGKVVPASEELGISQIVWSPMAQGVLSGKYLPGQPVPEGSPRDRREERRAFIKRFLDDDVLTAVQSLKPIAEQAGLTMPQLAIAWVLQNKNVAAALVGASRPEQLADSVKASGVVLDAEMMAAIDDGARRGRPATTRRTPTACRRRPGSREAREEDPTMASDQRRHPPLPAHARARGADRPHGRAVLGGEG